MPSITRIIQPNVRTLVAAAKGQRGFGCATASELGAFAFSTAAGGRMEEDTFRNERRREAEFIQREE